MLSRPEARHEVAVSGGATSTGWTERGTFPFGARYRGGEYDPYVRYDGRTCLRGAAGWQAGQVKGGTTSEEGRGGALRATATLDNPLFLPVTGQEAAFGCRRR